MGYSSLARVLTGWTGTIVWADVSSGTFTPFTRESVASVMARLVYEMTVSGQTGVTIEVTAAGLVTIGGAAPDFTFTGNIATRTGFTAGGGIYSGGGPYVAASSFSGAYVPAYGLRLADPLLATSRGAHVGSGAAGVSPVMVSGASRLMLWHSAITVPDMSYEYDVWHDGRVFGRVLAKSFVRVPMSTLRTVSTTRIDLDVMEVA